MRFKFAFFRIIDNISFFSDVLKDGNDPKKYVSRNSSLMSIYITIY